MRIFQIRRRPITEEYISGLGNSWAILFAKHGKLSGFFIEDQQFLQKFQALAEEEKVEFDPFGHLTTSGKIDIKKDCILSFSRGNEKLKYLDVVYISLPAGYACPFADICKSMAHRHGKKFKTGKSIIDLGDIRCYAASAEMRWPAVRKQRWRNFDLLRQFKGDVGGMADLILRSFDYYESKNPPIKLFRIHESGDFFSQEYFDAWLQVVKTRSNILFYAYTKSLPFWAARKGEIPKNLRLVASEGGTMDELIDKEQFRRTIIVKDQGEAIRRRLQIDSNDFLAAFGDKDFALLLHGPQPKEAGTHAQAQRNSALLKGAKKLNVSPTEIDRLFRYYTS
jgi:hypothetical protein